MQYQNMKRLCVLVLREKNGNGFDRTLTRIVREELGDAALETVRDHVKRDATVITYDMGPLSVDLRMI